MEASPARRARRAKRGSRGARSPGGGPRSPPAREELVQCAAAVRAVRAGELDRVIMPQAPLDILAQQIVAIAGSEEIGSEELFDLIRRSHAYRQLSREDVEQTLEMVAGGGTTRRGRRAAHAQHDRVNGK